MNFCLLNKLVSDSKLGKAQIAKGAKMSRTTLDNALNGADIKISTLESLAETLGVTVGCFFEESVMKQKSVANGKCSVAAIHSEVNIENDKSEILRERIKSLEAILAEKERTIKILMENR